MIPQKAHAANDPKQMARLYQQYMKEPSDKLYARGHRLLEEGELDEAMVCFTIVGNRPTEGLTADEKRTCAYALNNAGGIAQLRFNFSSAFGYFEKAMQVADEPIYQTYNNIAGIYLFFNDYGNAKRYLQQAFDVGMEREDWASVANSLQNIMYLNWCLDSVGQSIPYINTYMRAREIPHDTLFHSVATIAEGMTLMAKGQRREAIERFRQFLSEENANPISRNKDANSVHLYLASAYMQTGDYTQALATLRNTEQEARAGGITDLLMQVLQHQMKCYRQMGNAEAERQVKYSLMSLKDSINTAEEFGKIKNIEFFNEVEKYEKQVVRLNQEKNTRSIVALVSCIALVVLGILLWLMVVQNRRLTESNSDLFHRNEELVSLADSEKRLRKNYTQRIASLEQALREKSSSGSGERGAGSENTEQAQNIAGSEENYPRSSLPATRSSKKSEAMSDEFRATIMERIYQQMDDVSFISQQDLTVERLAQAIDTNEKYVSMVINEQMDKNFNTLLNEYRIREICKRLTDFEHYGHMTNETIAEGVGFKSRSHFIRTFKKITGLTPSQYQKIAKREAS